ncbi:Aldehyde:ferredoxin oxidoreductase [Paucidesulfovibrio gracilis DSM 16080]|uniref:Aldehyde:ferredoxin oxidoreductase n=1 Tax=Paucidesulfovibrio gracilis DSM 16080 TaxID=1121449 RepID=A0A1T4W9N3_9BACT|nr:aldehyde ferredoxin oxidoreductase C-terminal domain-containing protein [Paucidesulfovibrio gracilis]SKA73986.1 Aldehyde:ferredoxin oxidoreductase [Paucidesulfovibrio gracilis DSM 16080]
MRPLASFGGWTGRYLHVDLNRQKCREYPLPMDARLHWLGGRGLGAFFLSPCASLAWDHPDMPISFCAGPLTGTTVPGTGSVHITTRSPLTGAVGHAAAGGRFGQELKQAGWDAVVITGHSPHPCGLEIRDQEARLVPAHTLARSPASHIFTALEEFGSTACIGQAAVNGCAFASILVDRHHAAQRTGLGRPLAVKRLQYIAIRGTQAVPCADPEGLERAKRDITRLIMASPALMGRYGLHRYGEAALFDPVHARHAAAVQHFRATCFSGRSGCNGPALGRSYRSHKHDCASCPVGCTRVVPALEDQSGFSLPGFHALNHFTALLGNADLDAAVHAHRQCMEWGMDPVSAGATLACLAELRGQDIAPDELLELLQAMALGTTPLCHGAEALARHAGRPEIAMTVKGLELPGLDPRGSYGFALACAVSTRGGCAEGALPLSHEILRKPAPTDRHSFAGKARMVKLAEDHIAALESLGVCRRLFFGPGLEEYARAMRAVTGLDTEQASALALARCGEQVVLEERRINAANGFTAVHDDLPSRFFTPKHKGKQTAGQTSAPDPLSRRAFLAARERYYQIRGLDRQGRPLDGRHSPPPHAPLPQSACPDAGPLQDALMRCETRLVRTGLVHAGQPPLLAALDNTLVWNRTEPHEAGQRAILESILTASGASALTLVRPAFPYAPLLDLLGREALADQGSDPARITPRDCETRTFLHDIPVCATLHPNLAKTALADRKSCVIPGLGVLALGSMVPEQALVSISSTCFALFVLFASQLLQSDPADISQKRLALYQRLRKHAHPDTEPAKPHPTPEHGPFADRAAALAAMTEAGRAVVEHGLVDSSFGNVSCLCSESSGQTMLISQTGSFLDQLEDCVDACPLDGSSTEGMTASSECLAHERTYALDPRIRTILHGHPPFSVILSMRCNEPDAPTCDVGRAGECHLRCPKERFLDIPGPCAVPIIPGEVGTGPTGLCQTLPHALTKYGVAVVHGHGVFAVGDTDFAHPFQLLQETETACARAFFEHMDQRLQHG